MSDLLEYLQAVYGDGTGRAHVAVGTGPRRSETGKYEHEQWTPSHYAWPAEAERMARDLAAEAVAGGDVYVCPYLMVSTKRAKGAAAARPLVHADCDGELPLDKVHALGAFAVASGTAGHGHVYVPLSASVPAHWHRALCVGLRDHLGHADAKITDNDVLRPPGTLNYKPTTTGGEPAPVEWLVRPNGATRDPHELAADLGVTLPADTAPPSPASTERTVARVDLDALPQRVRDALAEITGDRSADTMRVVGACHDAGLTLAQTRYVVGLRTDLAGRLAERTDDDVLTCWLKATDSRAQRRGDDSWLNNLPAAPADTADEPEVADEDDPAERARRLWPRLDWHALWADDEEEEWIHHPLLPARRSVVIYSRPKVGKSLLLLEMAVAISRGDTFLGYRMERRYRVLYVDFENDPRGDVRARLQAMGYGPDDLDHLDYLSFPQLAGLDTPRGAAELLQAVKAYGAEVVVIDTVSRAVDGEENSNDTWLGLYRNTLLQLKREGVAVVRLDHTGKDESKGQRGGSAKAGDVDAIWKLTSVTDTRYRLECTDARLPITTKSLHLTRHTTPTLRHTAEVLGAQTDREARVAHIVALCDANGLPADTGRDGIKAFANGRGIKARNDVFAEVARVRKAAAGPVPDLGDSHPGTDRPNSPGTTGDSDPHQPPLTSTDTCPQTSGTTGDNAHRPHLSPSPHPIGGTEGTAGQHHPTCLACGLPLHSLLAAAGHTTHPTCLEDA